jgi:hypothetical protein
MREFTVIKLASYMDRVSIEYFAAAGETFAAEADFFLEDLVFIFSFKLLIKK